MLENFKKFFIKFFNLEPKVNLDNIDKVMGHPDNQDYPGLTYKLNAIITCTDVPAQENIPEEITVAFRAVDKEQAISMIFRMLSSNWKDIKKQCEKLSNEERSNNGLDKK